MPCHYIGPRHALGRITRCMRVATVAYKINTKIQGPSLDSSGARSGTSPSATEAANASIGPPPTPPMPPLLPPQPPLRQLRVDLICCHAAAAATVVDAAAATAAICIRMAHGADKDGRRATAIACDCTRAFCCMGLHRYLQTCCHRDTLQPPSLSNRSTERL